MLPFLTKKSNNDAGLIVQQRQPDESSDGAQDQDSNDSGLEEAMRPLCEAMHARDYKAMAAAFKDAFEIAEMAPHDEYNDNGDEYNG